MAHRGVTITLAALCTAVLITLWPSVGAALESSAVFGALEGHQAKGAVSANLSAAPGAAGDSLVLARLSALETPTPTATAATLPSPTATQTLPPVRYWVHLPAVLRGVNRALPTPIPTATPSNWFFDDFSDPSSGWPERDLEDYLARYLDGEYQVLVKNPETGGGVTHPGFHCKDCLVEVDAKYASAAYGVYGLSFGVTESEDAGYMFVVWEHGDPAQPAYYDLWKYGGGGFEPILEKQLSPHIRRGQETNRLRVVRTGDDIALFVNWHHLVTVEDDDLIGALRVGLTAGAGEEQSNVDIRFDNFLGAPLDAPLTGEIADQYPSGAGEDRLPRGQEVHNLLGVVSEMITRLRALVVQ